MSLHGTVYTTQRASALVTPLETQEVRLFRPSNDPFRPEEE